MFPFFARWRAGFEEDEKKILIGDWIGGLLELANSSNYMFFSLGCGWGDCWRCSKESYVEITRVPYMMIIYSVEYCTPLTAKRTNDQLIIFRKKITIK